MTRLRLSREGILGHRRRCGLLDRRAPWDDGSVRRAAWAGLTDSMPRAALLALHARLAHVGADALQDASLVQVWGPRYSVYVVHDRDAAVFTRGRLPAGGAGRARAEEIASRLADTLEGRAADVREAAADLGLHHNALRYAAPTGTVRLRWDGARQPALWTVPVPDVDDDEIRRELARRHLHTHGAASPASYARWAGLRAGPAAAVFDALADELVRVTTPVGERWILAADEESLRTPPTPPAPVRLLPSGDAYWLCWGADRMLLVDDAGRRATLWTSRVWPGAVMVEGEIVGTWRRSGHAVTIEPWQKLTDGAYEAIEAEARSFPLPGPGQAVTVSFAPQPGR